MVWNFGPKPLRHCHIFKKRDLPLRARAENPPLVSCGTAFLERFGGLEFRPRDPTTLTRQTVQISAWAFLADRPNVRTP